MIRDAGGRDHIWGDTGADRVDVRDGKADVVWCGPGSDSAVLDVFDYPIECERSLRHYIGAYLVGAKHGGGRLELDIRCDARFDGPCAGGVEVRDRGGARLARGTFGRSRRC